MGWYSYIGRAALTYAVVTHGYMGWLLNQTDYICCFCCILYLSV